MIRKAFKMFLYPGMEEEYEKRHNLLWPEMKEMIHAHGGHMADIMETNEDNSPVSVDLAPVFHLD